MAQLIVNGACQVSIHMECSGQEVINVLGFDRNFAESTLAIATAVKTAWEKTGGPLAIKPSQLKVIKYRAVELNAGGEVAELTSTAVGKVTAAQLATMASAALVNIGSATRNRSQRGRLYHGPLTESQIETDGRSLLPGFAGQLTTCYNQFRTDMATAQIPWVVISRKNASFSPVNTVSVQPIIATQRRRQR